jgi:hypothetical protein
MIVLAFPGLNELHCSLSFGDIPLLILTTLKTRVWVIVVAFVPLRKNCASVFPCRLLSRERIIKCGFRTQVTGAHF